MLKSLRLRFVALLRRSKSTLARAYPGQTFRHKLISQSDGLLQWVSSRGLSIDAITAETGVPASSTAVDGRQDGTSCNADGLHSGHPATKKSLPGPGYLDLTQWG